MQTTFTRLVERGHETQPETRKAWLFRVAYHEAILLRRRDAVGDKAVRRVAWRGNADQVRTHPTEALVQLETVEEVRAAIASLPPEQRQIVRMRVYDEKRFVDIAEELKIPIGTALGRMRAALKKLRAYLK